jgi:hypothetical protein
MVVCSVVSRANRLLADVEARHFVIPAEAEMAPRRPMDRAYGQPAMRPQAGTFKLAHRG